MPDQATSSAPPVRITDADDEFEQHIGDMGLSEKHRQFLRTLHLAEKRMNDAFEMAHRSGDLAAKISRVYHDFYRAD